jgi:hypothetical protein
MSEIANQKIRESGSKAFSHYKMQLSSTSELRSEFKECWEQLKYYQRKALIKEILFQSTLLSVFALLTALSIKFFN